MSTEAQFLGRAEAKRKGEAMAWRARQQRLRRTRDLERVKLRAAELKKAGVTK